MSVHYSSKVWKLETESAAEKLILLKLADNANDNGVCWPSVERMGEECQTDRRTIQRILRKLEEKGWLSVTPRAGHSSVYKFTLPEGGMVPPRQDAAPVLRRPGGGVVSPPGAAYSRPEPSVDPSKEPPVGSGAEVEWETAKRWWEDWKKNGADYTEFEARGAFLALQASGWMWGRNRVSDPRAALERQIQTDRERKSHGSKTRQPSNKRNDGVAGAGQTDYGEAARRKVERQMAQAANPSSKTEGNGT